MYEGQLASGIARSVQGRSLMPEASCSRKNHPRPHSWAGAVIYWFHPAPPAKAVRPPVRNRAVVYIKETHELDRHHGLGEGQQRSRPAFATVYAQKGMWNIFIVVFCFRASRCRSSILLFIGYLIGNRVLRFVPGHLHGQRRRRVEQRQENCRGWTSARRAH